MQANQSQQRFNPSFQPSEFDGKCLRKAVVRKTIDYNSGIIHQLQARVWQRDYRDQRALQPDSSYYPELVPPAHLNHNSINAVTTKFVRSAMNKTHSPIFCLAWTPEGRRLITGASSGEFTLWNGLTFNFETILQAHDSAVRCMIWSHNDSWMVTGDHSGYVKYWQSNMNNVKMFRAHKEPLRAISFCHNDTKFASCSDDGTIRIWDFLRSNEERTLCGHGAEVRCLDWHPQKALIVSGSKDSQQPIKLWDPKSAKSLATLHTHKNAVMDLKWNRNGNWLLTASRDHLIKLFDIRNLSQDVQTFRGHKKEVASLAWHPIHESLFCSGGYDGSVMFWDFATDNEVGVMEQAHDSCVWSLAWHPLGHILCSGSNDHSTKFWARNRPGDKMEDKFNSKASTSVVGDHVPEICDEIIPGLELELGDKKEVIKVEASVIIPDRPEMIKFPKSKPIPGEFQQQWSENTSKMPLLATPVKDEQNIAPSSRPESHQQREFRFGDNDNFRENREFSFGSRDGHDMGRFNNTNYNFSSRFEEDNDGSRLRCQRDFLIASRRGNNNGMGNFGNRGGGDVRPGSRGGRSDNYSSFRDSGSGKRYREDRRDSRENMNREGVYGNDGMRGNGRGFHGNNSKRARNGGYNY
uniref:Vps41 beta-propeller domain-containing protein n=1 Tax=Strigamia maritima TaxID=126957 RepID=T1IMW3_STRMM